MANKWINYVYGETDYRRGELAVALKLADAANTHTDTCRLTIDTIAMLTRLGPRQVKRILQHFESDGFLEIERFAGRGKHPQFRIKKVTSKTPFRDRPTTIPKLKKVTLATPIPEPEKVTFGALKGDIASMEKVTFETSPLNKDEPLIEPITITPPKPKKEPTTDHSILMRHHADRIGKIMDGSSQGKAIQSLLKNGFSVADCIACYDYEVSELKGEPNGWRSSVNWNTVRGFIAEWDKAGKPKTAQGQNGTNRKHSNNDKPTPGRVIANRPYR